VYSPKWFAFVEPLSMPESHTSTTMPESLNCCWVNPFEVSQARYPGPEGPLPVKLAGHDHALPLVELARHHIGRNRNHVGPRRDRLDFFRSHAHHDVAVVAERLVALERLLGQPVSNATVSALAVSSSTSCMANKSSSPVKIAAGLRRLGSGAGMNLVPRQIGPFPSHVLGTTAQRLHRRRTAIDQIRVLRNEVHDLEPGSFATAPPTPDESLRRTEPDAAGCRRNPRTGRARAPASTLAPYGYPRNSGGWFAPKQQLDRRRKRKIPTQPDGISTSWGALLFSEWMHR
jgi:hypothetical protein